MSFFSEFSFRDSSDMDAFGHLRVANPEALCALQQTYDSEPLELEAGFNGSGVAPVYNDTQRCTYLKTNAGSGESFLQSYKYWPYQPGRSQSIEVTGRFGTPIAGVKVDFGLFDSKNGIFYRQNGTSGVQTCVRSSTSGATVDDLVDQVNWNIDKFDGTGPSGIILDAAAVFIFVIDYQFLGMGRVRVGFDIDGQKFYCHEYSHSNIVSIPYMQRANLPIQILVTATAALAASGDVFFKGAVVISEGGIIKDLGIQFSSTDILLTAGTTRTHGFSIRPKLAFGGTITNRVCYLIKTLNALMLGSNPVLYEIVVGAAFSVAPTYADINTTFCSAEVGTGGTFSNLASGVVLISGYIHSGASAKGFIKDQVNLLNPIALNRANAQIPLGTISVLFTAFTGTSQLRASCDFTELR